MPTTVKNLGAVRVDYSTMVLRPRSITVERAGPSGPSVWRNPGRPIITTAEETIAHVGDAYSKGDWGRDFEDDEPFLASNDVQRCSVTFRTGATASKPRTLYMTFVDLADVDRTGADLWFNQAHVRVPFQPNGRVNTFEIKTTNDLLKLTVDVGLMPSATRAGQADGWAARFPCLKVVS